MRWVLVTMGLVLGCGGEEGVDPTRDSDGDGLSDLAEGLLGTDPQSADTDGDGYRDSDELVEGTDPNDANSVIYKGGWPYNPDRSALNDPGWSAIPEDGGQIPDFVGLDAHGDEVHLYDFAGQGKLIVLDFGTEFCKPCRAMAAYLATNDEDELIWNDEGEHYPWWESERYGDLYRMVQEGEIYWITVLFTTTGEEGPTQDVCEEWDASFPNPNIPVLSDTTNQFSQWMGIGSWPAISVVNDEMVFEVYQPSGPFSALRWLFPQD